MSVGSKFSGHESGAARWMIQWQAKVKQTATNLQTKIRLEKWFAFYAVVITAVVYTIRAHTYIIKPQFWAEDGAVWLANAVNHGLRPTFRPYAGMFHITEGLFGFVVAHVSLTYAPFLFNAAALGLFCLMIYYVFSRRSHIFADNFQRAFALVLFCLIANMKEIYFNFSNAIFLIGIIGFLVIFVDKAKSKVVQRLEKILFVLSCVTLPFCYAYVVVLGYAVLRKQRKFDFYFLVALGGVLLQTFAIFVLDPKGRPSADPAILLSRYTPLAIYNQIVIPATRLARIDIPIGPYLRPSIIVVWLGFLTAIAALIFTVIRNRQRMFYPIFFLVVMTVAVLVSPLAPTNATDAARFLATADGLSRYYIFGIVAMYLAMTFIASVFLREKYRYIALIVFASFGLVTSLRYHAFFIHKDLQDYTYQYNTQIRQFESGAVKSVKIPTNPKGWLVELNRK